MIEQRWQRRRYVTNTSQWLFHKGAKLFHITKPEATDATKQLDEATQHWCKSLKPTPGRNKWTLTLAAGC